MTQDTLRSLEEFLSNSSKRILLYANEAGKEYKAPDIDTEHLLLGVIKSAEKDQILATLFQKLEVNLQELEATLKKKISTGEQASSDKFLAFSPRTKNVLISADQIRRQWNHHSINSEHLLYALADSEGIAQKILTPFGVTTEALSEIILSVVGKGEEQDILVNTSTPLLDQYGVDLCQQAREGKIDPVIGRAEEIERSIHILARRRKNNPLLIGEPGVGKTAIVEGLAHRMITGDVPDVLKGKRIISLSINTLVAGASKRGEFEARLDGVIKEATKSMGEVILFIDEIHTLVDGESAGDASQILKPALARGEIHCIGATTVAEHHEYVERDQAFARRFQVVTVPEPDFDDTFAILGGSRDKYEAFHKVKISDEILRLAIRLSTRYITDRFLPDKAFDLLDESAAMAKMPSVSRPEEEKQLKRKLDQLQAELQRVKGLGNLEDITKLQKEVSETEEKLQEVQGKTEDQQMRSHDEVLPDHIFSVISRWSGIPLEHLEKSEANRLLSLENILHEHVIGQEYAVQAVAKAIRRARSGIRKPLRPIGSFLFLGPSGVGKTELAKVLGNVLFGRDDVIIRFDMSEFMERHAVSRLTGPPPGYVGYEKGGELTEAVRKRPYAIVLLDEVEKAHKDVFNLLLQILDEGHLTDNHGRRVSFAHTIVVCTSNLGAEQINAHYERFWQQKNQGIAPKKLVEEEEKTEEEQDAATSEEEQKTTAMPETQEAFQKQEKKNFVTLLTKFFRPEILNRFDDILFFAPLRKPDLQNIVHITLHETEEMLKEKGISLRLKDAAKAFLAEKGYDPAFGARPLRRAIQEYLEDPLADDLLKGTFHDGDTIVIDANTERLTFSKGVAEKKAEKELDPFFALEGEEKTQTTDESEDKVSEAPEEDNAETKDPAETASQTSAKPGEAPSSDAPTEENISETPPEESPEEKEKREKDAFFESMLHSEEKPSQNNAGGGGFHFENGKIVED